MSVVKQVAGIKTSLTSASLSGLASGVYCVSATYNNATNNPLDLIVEVNASTTNTTSGNKQLVIFAQASYDNINWQTGPTSGSTTTDEPLLTLIGAIGIQTANIAEVKGFSVAAAYGGVLPPYVRFVTKDDLGATLTSGSLSTIEISVTVT